MSFHKIICTFFIIYANVFFYIFQSFYITTDQSYVFFLVAEEYSIFYG